MNKSKIAAALLIGGVILSGCGGKSGSTNNATSPLDGRVSDGYISGANVLVDINTKTKGGYDSGDYQTTTKLEGDFSIPTTVKVPKNTFIYASGGQIISTGEDFNGTLKGIFTGDKTSINLTPVTTMLAALVEKNGTVDDTVIQKAKEQVASALGIPANKVDADPVQDKEAFKAVQKVVTIAKVIQSKENNKSVSEIIEKIAQNLEDNNISKAVEKVTDDNTTAKIALEAAKTVEETIETLDDNITSNTAIENIIQTHIVSKVQEAIQEDKNVTKALQEAKEAIQENSTLAIAKAMECLSFNTIKGENSSALAVTKPLALSQKSLCEKDGVSISWIKAEPANINLSTGVIIQKQNAVTVELDANISKENAWAIKPIFLTIAPKTVTPTPGSNGNGGSSAGASNGNSGSNATLDSNHTVIKEAINTVKSFDFDNGDISTLINNLQTLFNSNSQDLEAQLGLALVDLINATDEEIAELLTVNGENASLAALLDKDRGQIALAAIDNFSDTTADALDNLAQKLNAVAMKLSAIVNKNPNYNFSNNKTTITANDLQAASALLSLQAALSEYASAYNIIDKQYIETKTATINGQEIEYQEFKVNPIAALNDPNTLSLNNNAQERLDKAKEYLNSFLATIITLDETKLKDAKAKETIAKIKPYSTALKASLNGGSEFVYNENNTSVSINVAALFNSATAPTLKNTLGNNWEYKVYDLSGGATYEYNKDYSIRKNRPIVTVTEGDNSFVEEANIEPTIPIPNAIEKIVTKLQTPKGVFTGNEVTKYIFGEIELQEPNISSFQSAADITLEYKISNSIVGDSSPYSCSIIYSNYQDFSGNNPSQNDVLTAQMLNTNTCEVKLKSGVNIGAGYIDFALLVTDKYGHKEETWGTIHIQN